MLFSKSTYDEIAATLGEAGIEAQDHRSTISPVPLYSLPAAAVAGLA